MTEASEPSASSAPSVAPAPPQAEGSVAVGAGTAGNGDGHSAASVAPSATAAPGRVRWTALASPFALGFYVTLGALVAILLGMAFSNLSTIIIYVVLAMFVALGLDPVVRFLERRRLTRVWAIVVVYLIFALVLAGIVGLVVPTLVRQITGFLQNLPSIISGFMAGDVFQWLESTFGDGVGDLVDQAQSFVTNPANLAAIGGGVLAVGFSIATAISGLVIVLVLSLYFLASLPVIKRAFVRLVPARNRTRVSGMTDQITDSIGGYLMGMVILAFCNSVFAFLLYFFLGLPFPLLMAVVAFSVTLIPLIGSVLFWITGSIVALLSDPVSALIFACAYLVYMQLEAYVLTPRVMNRTISVPGALVVIGALVGGTLLGLLGALVAIPVTASVLLIIKQVLVPRQDAKL